MKSAHWPAAALAAASFATAGGAQAQSTLTLMVNLPEDETWEQISDRTQGQAYSKEWVPEGDDADEPSWLVSEQKVPVERDVDADSFLQTIYALTQEACKSATHEEIERVRVGSARAAVGRTQCGQRLDGYYGTFTDRLVIVDGGYAYVISSELRTPPMLVDGILSFGRGDDADSSSARRQFVEREALSRELVRDGVTVE